MVQAGGSESIRDDAFRLPPASRSSGRVKRLPKIADQMKPGLERDQPFARMIDAVPIGFALFAAPSRSGPNPDTDPPRSPRSRCHLRSIRLFAAISNKRVRVDRTPMAILQRVIDRPKPNVLPVTEVRNPFDEKPTEDAEPATGVLNERETETAVRPGKERHPCS